MSESFSVSSSVPATLAPSTLTEASAAFSASARLIFACRAIAAMSILIVPFHVGRRWPFEALEPTTATDIASAAAPAASNSVRISVVLPSTREDRQDAGPGNYFALAGPGG